MPQVNVDEVLQRSGDEEELLLEAKFFSFNGFVVWVEDFGNVLRLHLVVNGSEVVGGVERAEVERVDGLRFPETQGVDGIGVIAKDWSVVRNGSDNVTGNPANPVIAVDIGIGFRVTT